MLTSATMGRISIENCSILTQITLLNVFYVLKDLDNKSTKEYVGGQMFFLDSV